VRLNASLYPLISILHRTCWFNLSGCDSKGFIHFLRLLRGSSMPKVRAMKKSEILSK